MVSVITPSPGHTSFTHWVVAPTAIPYPTKAAPSADMLQPTTLLMVLQDATNSRGVAVLEVGAVSRGSISWSDVRALEQLPPQIRRGSAGPSAKQSV